MTAFEAGQPLKEAILANAQITAHLSTDDIEALFDYRQQLGLGPQFVDRVLARAETEQQNDRAFLSS